MCSAVDCIFLGRDHFKRHTRVNPREKSGIRRRGETRAVTRARPRRCGIGTSCRGPCQAATDSYLAARSMPVHPSRVIHATKSADGRRTVIALLSATLMSLAVLALLAIFDVK